MIFEWSRYRIFKELWLDSKTIARNVVGEKMEAKQKDDIESYTFTSLEICNAS